MEEEIQDELEKIYTIPIEVKWRDFRIYDVYFTINKKVGSIAFIYDVQSTKEYNISNICQKIDNEIVKNFKKERKRKDG